MCFFGDLATLLPFDPHSEKVVVVLVLSKEFEFEQILADPELPKIPSLNVSCATLCLLFCP